MRRGVRSTPTFIVGGLIVPGALSYDSLKTLVDQARTRAGAPRPAAGGADTATKTRSP